MGVLVWRLGGTCLSISIGSYVEFDPSPQASLKFKEEEYSQMSLREQRLDNLRQKAVRFVWE